MAQHAPQTNSKQHHMPAHTNRKQHGVADKMAHNSKVEEHGTVKTKMALEGYSIQEASKFESRGQVMKKIL